MNNRQAQALRAKIMRRAFSPRAIGIAIAATAMACGGEVQTAQPLDSIQSPGIGGFGGMNAVVTGGRANISGAESFANGGAHAIGAGGTTGVMPSNMGGIGPQANLTSTNESASTPVPTVGTIGLNSDPTGAQTYAFGVCVEVDDTSSTLLGTKIFIPNSMQGRYY